MNADAAVSGTPARLYTCEEVAELLGVGTDWVRRKVQARTVAHVRLGRNVRFTDAQLQALIEQFTKTPIRVQRNKL